MTTETLTTPRTSEEVQAMIDRLTRRKAKLEQDTAEVLQMLPHTYEGAHRQFWAASETMEHRTRELRRIEDQLSVLRWVAGKFEHFPMA